MEATRGVPSPIRARRARRRSRVMGAAGGKFGLLLVALIALMAATPLIISGPVWNSVLRFFTGAVLVASLHAARPGSRAVAIGVVLALVDFTLGRLAAALNSWGLVVLQDAFWIITLVFVTVTILEAIFESEVVTVQTLQASLCVYLLLGLIGGFAFMLIDLLIPGSFESTNGPAFQWADIRSRETEFMRLFVLSYATLSGSGFAEIAPATGFASNAASLESMTGQIYLAVVIARLVGIHSAQPPSSGPARAGENGSGPVDAP